MKLTRRIVSALLTALPPTARHLAPAILGELKQRRIPPHRCFAELVGVAALVASEWVALVDHAARAGSLAAIHVVGRVAVHVRRRPSTVFGPALLLGGAAAAAATTSAFAFATPSWLPTIPQAEQLVWGVGYGLDESDQWVSLSAPEVREVSRTKSIDAVAGIQRTTASVRDGRRIVAWPAARVIGDLEAVLRSGPRRGRWPANVGEVALSPDLAWDRFGGTREALGRTISVDGSDALVVGILGENARLPWPGDVGSHHAHVVRPVEEARGRRSYFALARKAERVTEGDLAGELSALSRRQTASHPEQYRSDWRLAPLATTESGGPWSRPMRGAFRLSGALLLLTLAVLSQMARVERFTGSQARRLMILAGASHRAVLSDRIAIDACRGAVAVVIAGALGWLAIGPLRIASEQFRPGLAELAPDWRAFGAALLVSVVVGTGTLTLAGVRELRTDPGRCRTRWAPGGTSALGATLSVLVALAGISALSGWVTATRVDPSTDFAFAHIRLPVQVDGPRRAQLADSLTRTAERTGLAAHVGVADYRPLSGPLRWSTAKVARSDNQQHAHVVPAARLSVTPGYLAATGGALLAGRFLQDGDGGPREKVAVVDSLFASTAWGDSDEAIGSLVALRWEGRTPVWHRVVGVVRTPSSPVGPPPRGAVGLPMIESGESPDFTLFASGGGPRTAAALAELLEPLASDVHASTLGRSRANRALGDEVAAYLGLTLAVFALLLGTLTAASFVRSEAARQRARLTVELALGRSPSHARGACALRALAPAVVGGIAAVLVAGSLFSESTSTTAAIGVAAVHLVLTFASIGVATRRTIHGDLAREVLS